MEYDSDDNNSKQSKFLNKINNLDANEFIKLTDLKKGTSYKILDAEKIYNNKFGKYFISVKIRLDNKTYRMSLPNRYSELNSDEIHKMIGLYLVYKGLIDNGSYKTYNIKFSER